MKNQDNPGEERGSGDFERFLDHFMTSAALMEFVLDQGLKRFGAQQAALYWQRQAGELALRMVCGASPLELPDLCPPPQSAETESDPSVNEEKVSGPGGRSWKRLWVPLFEDGREGPKDAVPAERAKGLLLFHAAHPVAMDPGDLQRFASEFAQSLVEIERLEKGRKDGFRELERFAERCTGRNERQVARLATALAEEMGLTERECEEIGIAAIARDLGYSDLDRSFLHAPRDLEAEEWRQLRQHPEIGSKRAGELHLPRRVREIIRQHHEAFDGSGYPNRVRGEAIHPGARVLAVADTFSALTSDRPYRSRLDFFQARSIIESLAGKQFDPSVVEALPFALVRASQG